VVRVEDVHIFSFASRATRDGIRKVRTQARTHARRACRIADAWTFARRADDGNSTINAR
jgi:hypothetical protein